MVLLNRLDVHRAAEPTEIIEAAQSGNLGGGVPAAGLGPTPNA